MFFSIVNLGGYVTELHHLIDLSFQEYTMIGSFLTSGLVLIFGYAYPAYECYKTVERNKPEIEQLRFWCQYWILVALLAVCERVSDIFISWIPMYGEAKLAFYIYLWYPKTKGTMHVYDSFVKPLIVKHEKDIDRKLMELKTRAGDMIVLYFQMAASYGQTRVFDILQFVASRPFPRPYQNQAQPKQKVSRAARRPTVAEPPSPTSSSSSSQNEEEVENEVSISPADPIPTVVLKSPSKLTPATPNSIQLTPKKRASESKNLEASNKSEVKTTPEKNEISDESANEAEIEETDQPVPSHQDREKSPSPPQESTMEDAIRETRGRLRKSRSIAKKDE
ncbi:hypothetical protein V2J09_017157 [Rumex salicifolius]